MGRFSETVLGRKELPESCLIFAGAYISERKEPVRRLFDKWSRIAGNWVKFTFAKKDGEEFLAVFNVYGGSMILELLYLLHDGGVRNVFLIGSMGGKNLAVGTIVLPTQVIDKTGLVSIDEKTLSVVKPESNCLKQLRSVLKRRGESYVEGQTVSVPAFFII